MPSSFLLTFFSIVDRLLRVDSIIFMTTCRSLDLVSVDSQPSEILMFHINPLKRELTSSSTFDVWQWKWCKRDINCRLLHERELGRPIWLDSVDWQPSEMLTLRNPVKKENSNNMFEVWHNENGAKGILIAECCKNENWVVPFDWIVAIGNPVKCWCCVTQWKKNSSNAFASTTRCLRYA